MNWFLLTGFYMRATLALNGLKLSISGKQFFRSDEPLSDKIMNVIISKFNDLIILYSKEGQSLIATY